MRLCKLKSLFSKFVPDFSATGQELRESETQTGKPEGCQSGSVGLTSLRVQVAASLIWFSVTEAFTMEQHVHTCHASFIGFSIQTLSDFVCL